MDAIKLSICIPTYNRAPFLRKLLTHLKSDARFDFRFEIVVSDNASTDNTEEVAQEFIAQGLPLRYFRRPENGGGWPNMTCAFLRSEGEFAIYVADDDLPICDGIAAAIAYLDRNPDVVACYAPWLLHDEIDKKDTGQFYRVKQDTKFANRSFPELFQFIFEGHVFPEIGIYRTSELRSAYVPREFCFWAFAYLAHFLDKGAVAFLERPFYRSVTRSSVRRDRQQAGHEEVMTAWDRYRGGLEYFLYVGTKRGRIGTAAEQRQRVDEMCKIFTLNRMAVALRFWVARKDYIKAYELYVRLVFGGLSHHDEVKKVRDMLPLMAGVQTFARQVNATTGINRLILSNVADVASLSGLLYEVGLDRSVEVTGELADDASVRREQTMVFTTTAAERDKFIARGYAPNLVFYENDLTTHLIV
ncbi:glycosyltransferase family 2 protein [Hyphomicrobium sp.]|uniref:glycosyltransferase family 2 protein n=1 Tax=Hyphomicrobium sp. TaxID=82 RepID=UPI002D18B663|nr:glycosyltransferase family 2 protein [Hyphomicrobium sp.]HRN88624.1 glycosyltransferase family 2 protein [Hyphomicrobium sp.]HRQ25754.1 glycosyltransferase family 2 protein [Hyphomicrobium sp.]